MKYKYYELKDIMLFDILVPITLKNANVLVDSDIDRHIQSHGIDVSPYLEYINVCIKEYDPFNPFLAYVYLRLS
jgi:hypothetical protein